LRKYACEATREGSWCEALTAPVTLPRCGVSWLVDHDPLVKYCRLQTMMAEKMNKFSCTRSLGEEIYFATLIAENAE
jgi:hypothetical protein